MNIKRDAQPRDKKEKYAKSCHHRNGNMVVPREESGGGAAIVI